MCMIYRIAGIIDKAFNHLQFDKTYVISQFLSSSLMIISSIDNIVTNHFVNLKSVKCSFQQFVKSKCCQYYPLYDNVGTP